MTEKFKQDWWDINLPNRMEEFNSWIGDKNAQSKIYCRIIVKDEEYKSLLDLGCGTATEFFAYKEEYPELQYMGVDSCRTLVEKNIELGVPTLLANVDNTNLDDNSYEVVFARHILEHQPTFAPTLNEMIRVSSKLVMVVFFMIPRDEPEAIGYNPENNLYHNRYDKRQIEEFLRSHPDVENYEWQQINVSENVLLIDKKK